MQRSIEIAISVFTDAETETPCMYDTVLHIKVPSVHSSCVLNLKKKKTIKFKKSQSICIHANLFMIFASFSV